MTFVFYDLKKKREESTLSAGPKVFVSEDLRLILCFCCWSGYDLEIADVKMETASDDGEIEFDEDDTYGPDGEDNPDFGDSSNPYLNMPASSSASFFHQPGLHFGASNYQKLFFQFCSVLIVCIVCSVACAKVCFLNFGMI